MMVQGQITSDHGCVILSRPGRPGGNESGFNSIRGREHYTA